MPNAYNCTIFNLSIILLCVLQLLCVALLLRSVSSRSRRCRHRSYDHIIANAYSELNYSRGQRLQCRIYTHFLCLTVNHIALWIYTAIWTEMLTTNILIAVEQIVFASCLLRCLYIVLFIFWLWNEACLFRGYSRIFCFPERRYLCILLYLKMAFLVEPFNFCFNIFNSWYQA